MARNLTKIFQNRQILRCLPRETQADLELTDNNFSLENPNFYDETVINTSHVSLISMNGVSGHAHVATIYTYIYKMHVKPSRHLILTIQRHA